jgi:hypothetical protein
MSPTGSPETSVSNLTPRKNPEDRRIKSNFCSRTLVEKKENGGHVVISSALGLTAVRMGHKRDENVKFGTVTEHKHMCNSTGGMR